MPDPMGPTLLVYAATACWAVLFVVAAVGILCLAGEALYRLAQFHKRGLARVRGKR